LGLRVATCTLWAPACTVKLFEECYLPAITNNSIGRFAVFALNDKAEQDDNCASIYHKSLLYLVSNAFEDVPRIPIVRDGIPILGMEKFIRGSQTLTNLFNAQADLVLAPNDGKQGDPSASGARHHGDFDDDLCTVAATFARIVPAAPPLTAKAKMVGAGTSQATIRFERSATSLRDRRLALDAKTRAAV
jgi:hypothetical protein